MPVLRLYQPGGVVVSRRLEGLSPANAGLVERLDPRLADALMRAQGLGSMVTLALDAALDAARAEGIRLANDDA